MEFASLAQAGASKRVAAMAVIAAVGGSLGFYAIHEHHTAQNLSVQNAQMTTELDVTQHRVSDLTAKVNMLLARSKAQRAPAAPPAQSATASKPGAARRLREDPRFKKLQSQLDAQGQAIAQTRNDLAGTQGDLVSARTELTGSIAHTHDELVLLQKKGERDYAEFDISKSKDFRRAGPFEIRLKKADNKHQFADLELLVDDRNLSQKHVNLYQPVMFSTPDSPQPAQVVINNITKDHIHGYVSAPKYRQSELASMSNAGDNAAGQNQASSDSNAQPAARQKLPKPH